MSCRQIADIVEVMAKAGASSEMIAAAVRQISDREEVRRVEMREQARIRKQRQRERQKAAQVTDVTRDIAGQSVTERDACDLPPPSPPVSPLFPSPTPLTNNPPLSPPASDLIEADATKPKRERGTRLTADWALPSEFIEWARDYRDPNHPDLQLTDEEIEREGHSIRDWSIGSKANGVKLDWPGTWRNWIRRETPKILRARPRAANGAGGYANGGRRSATTSKLAPDVSLFDALALAGAAAGNPRADAGWNQDQRDGAGEARRLASVEVLDRGDARGADARRAAGDRGGAGAVVLPLSAAGGR